MLCRFLALGALLRPKLMWNRQTGLNTLVQIPGGVRQFLQCWQVKDKLVMGKLWTFPTRVVLTTWGWGAHRGARGAQRQWLKCQAQLSLNARELLTIGEALRFLGSEIKGRHVLIQTDNASAVAYIIRPAGVLHINYLLGRGQSGIATGQKTGNYSNLSQKVGGSTVPG